jgi:hypothetical protein
MQMVLRDCLTILPQELSLVAGQLIPLVQQAVPPQSVKFSAESRRPLMLHTVPKPVKDCLAPHELVGVAVAAQLSGSVLSGQPQQLPVEVWHLQFCPGTVD